MACSISVACRGGTSKTLCSMSQPWTCRLDAAESKVQRNFQQGSDDESSILSRKADPTTILNLAEQRMQSLLDKFAADKTVRLRCAQRIFSSASANRQQEGFMSRPEAHMQLQRSAVYALHARSREESPCIAESCWSIAGTGGLCTGASRRQSNWSLTALPQAR